MPFSKKETLKKTKRHNPHTLLFISKWTKERWGCVSCLEGPKGCEARSEANPGRQRRRSRNAQILIINYFIWSGTYNDSRFPFGCLGRAPFGVGAFRASLRWVLRTLRPSMHLTQKPPISVKTPNNFQKIRLLTQKKIKIKFFFIFL